MSNQTTQIRDFTQLKVWHKAIELSDLIYGILGNFPKFEEYATKSQIIKSANSVSANIAEGNSQYSVKRELYHINIAIGSTMETKSWLLLCLRRNYITQEQLNQINLVLEEIIKMLHGYRKNLFMYIDNEEE
ncbi:four helix bundle protein [Acetoanaerobium noterae]|uniref:Four helix bundle protein n=1 Tax=Acetoanaerobium noterae TaxID=745369 RepID=A0A1T5DMH5_9FIRM|nr:four helix bundle protein [Acetoanaerobium noterae]SKB72874.1 four helix bundle protein [Acetoanaerobium noterae]